MSEPVKGTCRVNQIDHDLKPHEELVGVCVGWTPLTAAPTAPEMCVCGEIETAPIHSKEYCFSGIEGAHEFTPAAPTGSTEPQRPVNNCALLCGNYRSVISESERANYNAEAAAQNLIALQECQQALAKSLADYVLVKAELAEAKEEIKSLHKGGISWEQATGSDPDEL